MLFLVLATAAFSAENDRQASTKHTFRIYLVEEKVNFMKHNEVDLGDLELHKHALITENDIVEYDLGTHTMRLTEEAFEPFAKPAAWDFAVQYDDETHSLKAKGENHHGKTALLGKAFVVVADGQRCYLGAFTCSASSLSLSLPVINLVPLPKEVPTENSIRIDRAYPSAEFTRGEDPRCDVRIKSALEALGKLWMGR